MSDPYFKKWYGKNSKKLSEERKARYHSDPEYREQAIQRAREYRATRTRTSVPTAAQRMVVVDGKEVEVFRIGQVTDTIGASAGFIRKMETAGVIPKPKIESAHRYYLAHQVTLLKNFVAEVFQYPINSAARSDAIEKQKTLIHKSW